MPNKITVRISNNIYKYALGDEYYKMINPNEVNIISFYNSLTSEINNSNFIPNFFYVPESNRIGWQNKLGTEFYNDSYKINEDNFYIYPRYKSIYLDNPVVDSINTNFDLNTYTKSKINDYKEDYIKVRIEDSIKDNKNGINTENFESYIENESNNLYSSLISSLIPNESKSFAKNTNLTIYNSINDYNMLNTNISNSSSNNINKTIKGFVIPPNPYNAKIESTVNYRFTPYPRESLSKYDDTKFSVVKKISLNADKKYTLKLSDTSWPNTFLGGWTFSGKFTLKDLGDGLAYRPIYNYDIDEEETITSNLPSSLNDTWSKEGSKHPEVSEYNRKHPNNKMKGDSTLEGPDTSDLYLDTTTLSKSNKLYNCFIKSIKLYIKCSSDNSKNGEHIISIKDNNDVTPLSHTGPGNGENSNYVFTFTTPIKKIHIESSRRVAASAYFNYEVKLNSVTYIKSIHNDNTKLPDLNPVNVITIIKS